MTQQAWSLHSKRRSGADYFVQGINLACAKETRRYIIIPLFINALLLLAVYLFAYYKLQGIELLLKSYLPSYLQFLVSIAWFFVLILLLVISTFIFSTTANWIAAPFNGLLSAHVEARLTGKVPPDVGWGELIKNSLKREFQKILYYIPRAIALFIFICIPFIGQTVGTILWFIFSAWILAIQYYDYPFDNHKVPFYQMLSLFKGHRRIALEFGVIVLFCTMIPFLNLVIMPVAVCGATAMWVDRFYLSWTQTENNSFNGSNLSTTDVITSPPKKPGFELKID